MWILLASLVGAYAAPEMIPLEDADVVGRTAPGFELTMLDGSTFKLEDARGKPVVLSFWASWCGPCRKELPALADLARARDDVAIYAVNVDREKRLAEKFLQQVKVDLPIIWDPDSVALGQYDVLSMPTTFVVDANGTVKWRKTGYSTAKGLTELVSVLDGGEGK